MDKLGDNPVALQRSHQTSVNKDWRLRFLERAGQGDSYVSVFGFSGTVDHATHHRNFQFFNAGILRLPDRHIVAEIRLNLLRHLLEESAGRTSAAGTRGN